MRPVLDDEGGRDGAPAKGPVPVSMEVFDGIEAVRRSGLTNMLDRPTVAILARGIPRFLVAVFPWLPPCLAHDSAL